MSTPQNGQNTQTVRRQQSTNCLNVFNHSVGLALKGLSNIFGECLFTSAQVHSENKGLSHELVLHAKVCMV